METKEWVERATAKDEDRPSLKRIHYENNLIVATDGFRMHVTKDNELPYPEWKDKVKDTIKEKDNGIYIKIDSEHLIDAIKGSHTVVLHVIDFDKPLELNVMSYGNKIGYALIMPKIYKNQTEELKLNFWQPID